MLQHAFGAESTTPYAALFLCLVRLRFRLGIATRRGPGCSVVLLDQWSREQQRHIDLVHHFAATVSLATSSPDTPR